MVEELTGFDFPVTVTSGHEEVAHGIAERTQGARIWMSNLLAFEPAITVEVLGPHDWEERAEDVVYGLPHINDAGTMYLAATDSALFDDTVALTVEHLPEDWRGRFAAVYGDPPRMRAFRDLLSIHELAHTYHLQAGFVIEPLWLMEYFCNLALQGFVAELEPTARPVLETWPVAAAHIPPSRQGVEGLETMSMENPVTYVWYQLRLQLMAMRTWETGGRDLLHSLYDACRSAAAEGASLAPDRLPPEIASLVIDWPNV